MEAEPKDVGDQGLMRGSAFPIVRPRSSPIVLRASALLPATKRLTGIPSAVVPPPPMHDDKKGAQSGCLHLPGNRPHEPDQFTAIGAAMLGYEGAHLAAGGSAASQPLPIGR